MMAKSTQQSFRDAARTIERLAKAQGQTLRQGAGLRVIGEEIMTDVKASRPGRGVPVDTGALRSTGRVTGPANGVVRLSFGGTAAPYAIIQHEVLHFHHTVGEARYLVRGVERWTPNGSAAMQALREQAQATTRRVAQ
jgi:hypothetical protein